MKKERKHAIPNNCSRCGSDLMTGRSVLFLPFLQRYICFCSICSVGLKIETLYQQANPTQKEWDEFWEDEIEFTNCKHKEE